MTVQWTEGFEITRHQDLLDADYSSYIRSVGPTFLSGRLQGFALDGATTTQTFVTPNLEPDSLWVAGIAAQINAPDTGSGTLLLQFLDSGSAQTTLYVVASGDDYTLELWRGDNATGTLLDTSSLQTGSDGGYNYWELKILIHNTTGTYELRKNGAIVFSAGTADTQATGNASANQAAFGCERDNTASIGNPAFDIDDIYILNGLGSKNKDFLGDQVVLGAMPNASGDSTDFASESSGSPSGTANWDQVNDLATSVPDDDSGYVVSSTVGDKDLYNFENLAFATGDINGIRVVNRIRLEAGGSRNIQTKFKDPVNGESSVGDAYEVNAATWQNKSTLIDEHPVTLTNFTVANIDDGQWGFELLS